MRTMFRTIIVSVLLAGSGLGLGLNAEAALVGNTNFIPDCAQGGCDWSIKVGDAVVGSGTYQIDSTTGDISLAGPQRIDLSGGGFVSLNSLNGNADPILGFNASAGTGAAGNTFLFNFNLPIALSGSIDADSSVSYSLTSTTNAGAQIVPLFGKVVTAREVDTTVGGLSPLNKGVDVGDTFFFVGGPQTQNSPIYTASHQFLGSLDYDLMNVSVGFSLSPNSNVGISGFVQQVPNAPLPAAAWLFGSGVAGLIGLARRRNMP